MPLLNEITSVPVVSRDTEAKKVHKQEDTGPNPGGQVDPMLLAYYYIYEAVSIANSTSQVQAKGLEANAQIQNKLIGQEAQQNFITFRHSQLYHETFAGFTAYHGNPVMKFKETKRKLTANTLENLELENQKINGIRGVMEELISAAKQKASVDETNMGADIQKSQEAQQEGDSVLKLTIGLTNQILRS